MQTFTDVRKFSGDRDVSYQDMRELLERQLHAIALTLVHGAYNEWPRCIDGAAVLGVDLEQPLGKRASKLVATVQLELEPVSDGITRALRCSAVVSAGRA